MRSGDSEASAERLRVALELFAVAEERELRRARDAVERIEAAGFSRGRDLVAALEQWMGEKRR